MVRNLRFGPVESELDVTSFAPRYVRAAGVPSISGARITMLIIVFLELVSNAAKHLK